MADNILISTPAVGRLWQAQSRTPMMNGPVSVPPEVAKEIMEIGATVFKHNSVNPIEKVELTTENFDTPEKELFPGNCESAEEFIAAAANPEVKSITLTAPIELASTVKFNEYIEINGNNNKITFTGTGKVLQLVKGGKLKNIVIEGTLDDPAAWSSSYGLHLYNNDYVVENLKVSKMNAAMLCGASSVDLYGTVDVSENGFGGCEVSVGEKSEKVPYLNINSVTLVNTTEEYGKPTVWIDTKLGKGVISGVEKLNHVFIKEQDQYYLDKNNTVKPHEDPTCVVKGEEKYVINTPTEFTVTTTKGDHEEIMVKGTAEITAGKENIQKLEYYETAGDAGWKDLSIEDIAFGPSSGFPLMDATSKFRVTFKTAGSTSVNVWLYEASDPTKQKKVVEAEPYTFNISEE